MRSGIRSVISRAGRTPAKTTGVCLLLFLTAIAVAAPLVAPYDPNKTFAPYLSPGKGHLLGTDDVGHDVFSNLLYAARMSLAFGYLAALLSIAIGVTIGVIAGFYRGWTEELLMGVTDVFLLIPGLPLMIIMAAYMSPSIWNIVLVIGLLWWCSTARVVHSRVLQVREMQFVESTRALGYSGHYIIIRHVLINAKDIIFAKYALAVASAMLSEASLSFLGLGDPTSPSWGGMLHFAFSRGGFANDMWWWYLPPGLMICLCVAGFILITMDGNKKEYAAELI